MSCDSLSSLETHRLYLYFLRVKGIASKGRKLTNTNKENLDKNFN